MADDKKVTVVLVDDDKEFADVRGKSILDHFPDVQFIHCLTGTQLETQLQQGLRPDVVIMDYDLSKADDWQDGAHYTRKLKDDYPDMVIIGCCGPDNDGSITRRQEAFLKAGADAFVNTHDGSTAMLDELENWLPGEEDEGKWRTGLALATCSVMLALFWLGLLTVPGLVISFYTLPVGGAALFVFAVLYRFDRIPTEISVPAMSGALAMTVLGTLFYLLAASGAFAGVGLGGVLLVVVLAYLVLTRH